jgi:hypothetical protein
MGVDATLFARKARRAIYLDRLYYWMPDDDKAQVVYGKLRAMNAAKLVTADELQLLCRALIAEEAAETAAGEDPDRNQKTWLWKVCIRFAQEHPDDEFFIATDHDWPDSYDIAQRGSYEFWDPYGADHKLAPWQPGYVKPERKPPLRLPPEEQARQIESIAALVKALEAGCPEGVAPGKLTQGSSLKVESLECVMRAVTFTFPSRRRTLRESLRHINWHWLDVFTDGPRSFWWNVRNVHLPLNLKKDLSEFDRQHDVGVAVGPVEPAQHYCVPNCHCQQPCCPDGRGSCCSG